MSAAQHEKEPLEEISRKLSVLISLSLRHLSDDHDFASKRKQIGESARFLASFGLQSREIAEIIGAPVTSVRTLLTPSKKR
jgi:hypothetical protein